MRNIKLLLLLLRLLLPLLVLLLLLQLLLLLLMLILLSLTDTVRELRAEAGTSLRKNGANAGKGEELYGGEYCVRPVDRVGTPVFRMPAAAVVEAVAIELGSLVFVSYKVVDGVRGGCERAATISPLSLSLTLSLSLIPLQWLIQSPFFKSCSRGTTIGNRRQDVQVFRVGMERGLLWNGHMLAG